jgi:WD40 repeat protein
MVYSAVFSPDAKRLATYDQPGTIVVWDIATKRVLYTMDDTEVEGYEEPLFSPDGKILAAIVQRHDDPTILHRSVIKFWDAATGKPIGSLEGEFRMIDETIFSPDSTTFYAAIDQKSTVVWDVSSRKMKQKPFSAVGPYHFNGRGTLLAAATPARKSVVLLDPKTGRVTRTIPGFSFVVHLAFDPSGRFLAVNDEEDAGVRLKVWNLAAGRAIKGFDAVDSHPPSVFSANGKSVVLVQFEQDFADEPEENSRIGALFDPATGKKQKDLIVNFPIKGFGTTFSRDGRLLAVRSSSAVATTINESSLAVIDVSNGTLAASIPGYRRKVTSLAFTPDGRELISAHADSRFLSWDTKTWDPKRSLVLKSEDLDSDLKLIPGTKFFTDGILSNAYDLSTGRPVYEFTDSEFPNSYQAISGDGGLMFVPNEGEFQFYSVPGHKLRNSFLSPVDMEKASAISFALDSTGKKLAYGYDSALVVIDAENGKQVSRFALPKGEIANVAYSNDGRYIAVANSEDSSTTYRYTINVMDAGTGAVVFKQQADDPYYAFSNDSSGFVYLTRSDRLAFHRIADGRLLSESKVRVNRLSEKIYFAFHPTERWIAVGTEYGIQVFNTELGAQIARMR